MCNRLIKDSVHAAVFTVLEWYEKIKAFRHLVIGEEGRGRDGFGAHTWGDLNVRESAESYEETIGGSGDLRTGRRPVQIQVDFSLKQLPVILPVCL
jgi:hypothetical protein